MSYTNKVVWITGASSGIGEALAFKLAAAGAKLILSARRVDELERVKKTIGGNAEVKLLVVDLEQGNTLEQKTNEAIALFGHIDIMLHNGGISMRASALETSTELHRKVMEIDYFSYIEITRHLLPHMMQRNSGHFVVVSSVMGKLQTPMRSAYAAAKHALHGYFDCLRAEVWKNNIEVTILTPGFIQTNVTLNSLTPDGKKRNDVGKEIANGYPVDKAADQIIESIARKDRERFIGYRWRKEHLAIFVKRFFPGLFSKIAQNQIPD